MIKFFRKVRQRLLSENKFSKYLLYAVGEIVLVVIGILIALQINQRNEIQKTNRWEERFLFDLRNELEYDYAQLNTVYQKQTAKEEACRKVLDLIQSTGEKDKAVIDSLFTISQKDNTTFFPTKGVYESAVSAGKIENIKNDSLKYAIMNLYNRYYDRLVYNGEFLDGVVGRVDWEKNKYYDVSAGTIMSWDILDDADFSAQIRYLMNQIRVYTLIANMNLRQMELVMDRIGKELNQ